MRMKKIFLVLAAALCVATVSAQSKFESTVKNAAQTVASQKWSVGLRLGSQGQAIAECFYSENAYFEGRLGLSYYGVQELRDTKGNCLGVDATVLHNWNCCTWDWTPSAGQWYLDAGVGVNIGGHGRGMWCGIAGQAKFGIKFNKVPIRLAVDVTPVVGPWIQYGWKETTKTTTTEGVEVSTEVKHPARIGFNGLGLAGAAISATYCF